MPSGKAWNVLTTEPRFEFDVAESLDKLDHEVYVPMRRDFRQINRYSKRKVLRNFALMPGYVFIAPHSDVEWYEVLGVRHVRRVIAINRKPMYVFPAEMNALIEREKDGEFTAWDSERFMRSGHEFTIGDKVEIVIGPLTGCKAKVEEINEATARVLTEMFGSDRLVEVGLETLEAA